MKASSDIVCIFNECDEHPPEYPDGDNSLHSEISSILIELGQDSVEWQEGTAIVQFVIDTNGVLKNLEIIKSLGSLDSIILQAFQKLKKWIPATRNGKKIEYILRQPLMIRIETVDPIILNCPARIVADYEQVAEIQNCVVDPERRLQIGTVKKNPSYATPVFSPNPVTKELFIKTLGINDKWTSAKIGSISGVMLKVLDLREKKEARIDVASLKAGIYVLTIHRQDGSMIAHQFIK